MSVSIIIPTLNEADALPDTLAALEALSPPPCDIVVADAGSTDSTPDLVQKSVAELLPNLPKGRAKQMNAGAAATKGDILCFLHADTIVPPDFTQIAERVLEERGTALAGFISVMRGPTGVRRVTTAHNFIKTWYAPLLFRPISFFRGCRLLFGDQVMICRREDFEAIGGWDPEQAIMEEADLCLRVVREGRGRVRQVPRKVWSSDRRVAEWGFWRANLTYLYVGLMWGFGVKSQRLAEHYEDVR
nr:TIGR04283 family arsenosugar biosynthesis glycosyltransferase [Hyphomonas sp. Mor2]